MDEFARVEIQADDAPLGSGADARIKLLKFRLRVGEIRPIVVGPELGPLRRVEDVEQAAVPKRLAVQPHVRSLVQINFHAPFLQRAIRLGRPRTAGLPVAGRRLPENAAKVIEPGAFAARKLLDAAFPAHHRLVFGDGWVLAVRIRVITDFVPGQGSDHVLPAAPLERPTFFTYHLERRSNALPGEKDGDALGRIIALRQDVVLGVKPQDDVDVSRPGLLRSRRTRARGQDPRQCRSPKHPLRQSPHRHLIPPLLIG